MFSWLQWVSSRSTIECGWWSIITLLASIWMGKTLILSIAVITCRASKWLRVPLMTSVYLYIKVIGMTLCVWWTRMLRKVLKKQDRYILTSCQTSGIIVASLWSCRETGGKPKKKPLSSQNTIGIVSSMISKTKYKIKSQKVRNSFRKVFRRKKARWGSLSNCN